MPEKRQRNSAIELLRIGAMLLIVLSHFCAHNEINAYAKPFSFNKMFIQWGVLGNLGVDVFVIITGYFMSVKSFSAKRLTSLFTQVWFYSLSLAAVGIFALGIDVSFGGALRIFFPTVFSQHWFFSVYVILMLLSPFINTVIDGIDRKKFKILLICLALIWMFIPTFTTRDFYGSELPQFVMLYLIGAYFRKYPDNFMQSKRNRILMCFFGFFLLFLSTAVINLATESINALAQFGSYSNFFYQRSSVLVISAAIGLFSNAFINTVSSCAFGVYLIHENPYIKHWLWKEVFDVSAYYESALLPLYAIGITLLIYTACTLIELVRLKTVAKPMTFVLDKAVDAVTSRINKLL